MRSTTKSLPYCPPHHMFHIHLTSKHYTTPRDNRTHHRVVPGLHLFCGLFHQSLLGRAPARHGSRKENYLNRGLVFLAVGIWIPIAIYTSLRSTGGRFTQGSCMIKTTQRVLALQGFIGAPSIVLSTLAVISWSVSIVLARKEIWPPGER